MSEPLDISIREADLVRYAGELIVTLWKQRRQIEVLEARVDVLDPEPVAEPAEPTGDA